MKIQDLKVGTKFTTVGLSMSGKTTKTKCELIRYHGMNQYLILSGGCSILIDGNEDILNIIK
jgi:hypothetical protein